MADPTTTDPQTPPSRGPGAAEGVTFEQMGLRPEVLRALQDMGFSAPMDVQARTFPIARTGKDLMVQSRTGSGKTAAFGIPLIDQLVDAKEKYVQGIVLLPTRELALQVASELARIAAHLDVDVVPVYGGAPMGKQIEQLKAGGQIVCGTPGRVLDHLRRGTLQLDRVRCAVLDECDEMLSMGFQEDIEAILERTPAERQTLLFSATVPEGIQRLSKRFMRSPEMLKLSEGYVGVHEIRHVYYSIPGGNREGDLVRVLEFENPKRAIIFCNTREETGRVSEYLKGRGYSAEGISSDLSQSDREKVMSKMRAGDYQFMVATDVAARGIDLEDITHVINFSFPESPEVYIHRTGRTGRAGKTGTAVSLIGPTEVGSFYYLKLLYKIRPEERSLPSEIEIRSKREGERIEELRAAYPAEPTGEWKSLARRLMAALDAERLVGALLADRFSHGVRKAEANGRPAEPAPRPRADRPERPERESRYGRERERDRGRFERPERESRSERPEREARPEREPRAERPERESRPERAERDARPEQETRPEREGRPERSHDRDERRERPARPHARLTTEVESAVPRPERTERAPSPAREAASHPPRTEGSERRPEPRPEARSPREVRRSRQEDEFMDVWGDSGEAGAVEGSRPAEAPAREPVVAADAMVELDAGMARLYLNIGRKDRVRADDVATLVRESTGIEPSSIEVMNTHTYLNVPIEKAQVLIDALSGREFAGRTLGCEPARPRRR